MTTKDNEAAPVVIQSMYNKLEDKFKGQPVSMNKLLQSVPLLKSGLVLAGNLMNMANENVINNEDEKMSNSSII